MVISNLVLWNYYLKFLINSFLLLINDISDRIMNFSQGNLGRAKNVWPRECWGRGLKMFPCGRSTKVEVWRSMLPSYMLPSNNVMTDKPLELLVTSLVPKTMVFYGCLSITFCLVPFLVNIFLTSKLKYLWPRVSCFDGVLFHIPRLQARFWSKKADSLFHYHFSLLF